MPGSPSRGRFVWYDLMTPDPEGATAFYTKVVGWTLTEWEGAEETAGAPYQMWTAGEKPVGGLMALPEEAQERGAPPHWLAYVTVPDAEAVARKTQELGGSILKEPTTMPGVGTFAVLRDPQGAVFAPYTPEGDEPTSGGPPSDKEFSWNELATTDLQAAYEFYSSIFGWKTNEDMEMGGMGTYRIYGPEGESDISYGGMFAKTEQMPGSQHPHWLYYISVEDINAGVERVKENGGQVVHGPQEVPGGDFIAQCQDPQGAYFALHSLAKKEDG